MNRHISGLLRGALVLLLNLIGFGSLAAHQLPLKGTIVDAADGSTLIGASIYIASIDQGTVTDVDGNFSFSLEVGTYQAEVRYVGYKTLQLQINPADFNGNLTVKLHSETEVLDDVTVVSTVRKNSDLALIRQLRANTMVTSGISAQQIKRSVDNNASEVIKRIPGITLMDSKYVMVRGLSQRYNNVWMNGASVPGSEPDSRAFSFDLIPSGQIDNLMIVKSPAPEYPADFSGGFIHIATKDIPEQNDFSISLGGTLNDQTHFRPFTYYKGGNTDFLGFDGGFRALRGNFPAIVDDNDPALITRLTQSGFNNRWALSQQKPVADVKLLTSVNHTFRFGNGEKLGLIGALNYEHKYQRVVDMINNRYGLRNWIADEPSFDNEYKDDQYGITSILGGLCNIAFTPNATSNYALKNTVNVIGLNRYTFRDGYQNLSQKYLQQQQEYLYNSRLTYSGQLNGSWTLSEPSQLKACIGYSFANNDRPDRRRINREQNDNEVDPHYGQFRIDQNEISRDFSYLGEHIFSAKADYQYKFTLGATENSLKVGLYGEHRRRSYTNRIFYYRWNNDNVPVDFEYRDPVEGVLLDANYDAEKLYIHEEVDQRNSYKGRSWQTAAYAGYNIAVGAFNAYAGVRYEFNRMQLISNAYLREEGTETTNHDDGGLYPSVNLSYDVAKDHKIRLSYGMTVNRPEFRELSRSIYYDFDLFSNVGGNPDLKPAKIHNIDLRYEWYPSQTELVSLAFFYKHFRNPIEWSYFVTGGSYLYYFRNALKADNLGIELEVNKELDFIGLKGLSLRFNAAYIHSKVAFPEGSQEDDRPMQGQSPFIVNAMLFYRNEPTGLSAALQYNIIGKRIVGVGRSDQSQTGLINNAIPDSYEMPRHSLDLALGWEFAKNWNLKLKIKNLLNSKLRYVQFPKGILPDGTHKSAEEVTKEYKLGRSFGITLGYSFR